MLGIYFKGSKSYSERMCKLLSGKAINLFAFHIHTCVLNKKWNHLRAIARDTMSTLMNDFQIKCFKFIWEAQSRDRRELPPSGSLPRSLQWLGLSRIKARSQGFSPCLPCEWRALSAGVGPCCLGSAPTDNWSQELELRTEPTHSDVQCRCLNHQAKCYPWMNFF